MSITDNKRIDSKQAIEQGDTYLGIELGSTRIKAVLIDRDHKVLATGNHDWENRLEDNIWTYTLDDIWQGLQGAYQDLAAVVRRQYDVTLTTIGAIGISAMMHGYMVFDQSGELLVPFRTWRNTITGEAAAELTELFQYQIPQRWTIAHLYQAIKNREPHVKDIDYMITLEGYVHWMLTGQKVLGIGDVAGMFAVDVKAKDFDEKRVRQFDDLVAEHGFSWQLRDILPQALTAGEPAGSLTEAGANLLDPAGNLQAGIPLCPPEGDAGTGMVATNSVAVRTGNVSAGTSVFAMVVLEQELKKVHPELDLVTTPAGDLVAMVHCNNCTSDLNAWVGLFDEVLKSFGLDIDRNRVFGTLYQKALEGDADGGGLLAYNYFSGEHITGFEEGRPLFVRKPDSPLTLANFMRTHLFTSLGALKTGLDILFKEEKVALDELLGHGGLFKTKGVGQKIMAAAANVPVSVMETAGEGGAWGIAVLAAFMLQNQEQVSLADYLAKRVFSDMGVSRVIPDPQDAAGFESFMERYHAGLPIERAAVDTLR